MKPEQTEVLIREGEPDDCNFVYATLLRNYKHSSSFARPISDRVFFRYHHQILEGILKRGRLTVATPKIEPGLIVGYLLQENPAAIGRVVVHYLYVKFAMRGSGIARALLAEAADHVGKLAGVDSTRPAFTHLTEDGERLARHFPGSEYIPYLIA